jgi:hypothetical protein
MQTKHRGATIYGYTVCVISVITFIIALGNMIAAGLDISDPLYAGFKDNTYLSSFENYKVEAMQSISEDAAYIPDEATLRTMYDSARNDKIAHAMHTIHRNLTVSGIMLVLSIALFVIHWKWLRRFDRTVQEE